jgi:hypothetical protein
MAWMRSALFFPLLVGLILAPAQVRDPPLDQPLRPIDTPPAKLTTPHQVQTQKIRLPSQPPPTQVPKTLPVPVVPPSPCEIANSELRENARKIQVVVDTSTKPKAGFPVRIRWSRNQVKLFQSPTFLVIKTAAEVRFGGDGFMALTAGAMGPKQISFGLDGARAFIPIYRETDDTREGELSVTPFRNGSQRIEWAIVSIGPCGEQIVPSGQTGLSVAFGSPEIVLHNRFQDAEPLRRIRSRSGMYELLVFDGRYEVHDLTTGTKIVDRIGVEPNFSPQGRFVAARQLDDGSFDVVDLVSAKQVFKAGAKDISGFLAWGRNDSYLVHGGFRVGLVEIWNTIVDREPLWEALCATNSSAWSSIDANLNLDQGLLIVSLEHAPDPAPIFDLFVGRKVAPKEPLTDAAPTRLSRPFPADLAAAMNIAAPQGKMTKGWTVDGQLRLSHVFSEKNYSEARQQSEFLFTHNLVEKQGVPSSAPLVPGQLSGRALLGRGIAPASSRDIDAPVSHIIDRLAASNIDLRSPPKIVQLVSRALTVRINPNSSLEGVSKAVREIQKKVRVQPFLFTKKDADPKHHSYCQDANENTLSSPEKFSTTISHITGIWTWTEANAQRWIFQTACYARTHDIVPSYLVYVREKDRKPVILIDAIDGHWQSRDGLAAQVFRLTENLVAIAVPSTNSVKIFRFRDKAEVAARVPLIDGAQLADIRLTADERHIVQINRDGRFFVSRLTDSTQVLAGAYADDEVVVMSDGGLYDTTYEGAQSVQIAFVGQRGAYSFHQFEAALRRPGLAAAVLSGKTKDLEQPQINSPPTVNLTLSEAAAGGTRNGRVVADAEDGLVSITIFVDGRLKQRFAVNGKHADVSLTIEDVGGGRWVSAVSTDTNGSTSLPSAIKIPGPPRPQGTLRSLAIGVDKYVDPKIASLSYAKTDARNLAKALATTRGRVFNSIKTTLLLDEDVTPKTTLQTIYELANATNPEDTLVLFFAGHGVDGNNFGQADAGFMLTTHLSRTADLATTSVKWTDVANALARSKGTVIVVLDACHSGMAGREAFASNEAAASTLLTRTRAPIVVIAASKGRQLSEEDPQRGGGLFTAALVDAIVRDREKVQRAESALIDLGELYSAVKSRVMKDSEARQTPWMARNGLIGEMALF